MSTQNLGHPTPLMASGSVLTNTTTATVIASLTVPPAWLQPGTRLEIEHDGITVDDNSTDTLTLALRIKSGAKAVQTLVTTGAVNAAADDAAKHTGVVQILGKNSLAATGQAYINATQSGAPQVGQLQLDGTTFDAADPLVVDVLGTWSAAHEENIFRALSLVVRPILPQGR